VIRRSFSVLRHRSGLARGLAVGIVVGALLGGGLAIASIPSSTTRQITGCVNKTSGALRVIDYQAGKRCTSSETTISWSVGYRYLGSWNSTRAYAAQDVVVYKGSAYVGKLSSTNRVPSSYPAYWGLLALAGATGATGPTGPPGPNVGMLMVSMTGDGTGTVTFQGSGRVCTIACVETGPPNSSVTVTAQADPGYQFQGWDGACTTTDWDCSVSLSGNKEVRARFTKFTELVQIAVTGAGQGTVTSSPAGISCPGDCVATFHYGEEVTLTVSPGAGVALIGGWSGLPCIRTPANQCVIVPDQTLLGQVRLEPVQKLTLTTSIGGTAQASPQPAFCDNTVGSHDCFYVKGTTVTLTAQPDADRIFNGWSGDCTGKSDCVLTMDVDHTAQANFSPYWTLTVTSSGGGSGTVTSNPAGIDCGSDCTERYPPNTEVTLTATPDQGSVFDHWSGNFCNGSSNPVCIVTMGFDQQMVPFFEPGP
jgi:hypothetical protein